MDDTTVYKQSFETARDNGEVGLFHKSNERSTECSAAIDKAVADSNYKTNFYDLKTAARTVIGEYGPDRVAWVLAAVVEQSFNDGRYSNANREWAKDFDVPKDVQGCRVLTHPYVLDGFIDEARKIFDVLSWDTQEHNGEQVAGFNIRNSVLFENDRGFAFAENAGRVQSFVTWQFTEENGKRDYYWGHYYEDEGKALGDFAGRVAVYKEDHALAKKHALDAAKPSILARLQEGKRAAAQEQDRPKTAPKHDNNREV